MFLKTKAAFNLNLVALFAANLIILVQPMTTKNDTMTAYYVSTTGKNSNSGTAAKPLKSIQEAVDRATAGDEILIKAGTYSPVRIKNKNATKSNPIAIVAAPGDEGKVVISSGAYDRGAGISIENSSNIIVEDLKVTKSLFGIYLKESKNITIRDNKVYDIGQEAIHVSKNSSYVDIIDNTITDTGNRFGRYAEGIYLGTGSKSGDRTNQIEIRGNDISNTMSEAIDIKPYVSNVVVENNLIHDIKTGTSGALVIGLKQGYSGGNFTNADNVIVRNNQFWNISTSSPWNDGNAIRARSAATIYNNAIWNYQHRGIFIDRAPSDNQIEIYHNTVYRADGSGTKGDIVVSKTSADVKLQNNIGYSSGNNMSGSDELFVAPKQHDFRLRSGAAAVDAGIAITAVKTDLDGYTRVWGKAPDLGAYEYQIFR